MGNLLRHRSSMILLAQKADSLVSRTKCYQNQGRALLAN